MAYQCPDCEQYLWRHDCNQTYDGGSGYFACPDCDSTVKKVVGPVGEDILRELGNTEPLSKRELANATGHDEEIVDNSLRHLLTMSYLGTASRFKYKRGSKGRKYFG